MGLTTIRTRRGIAGCWVWLCVSLTPALVSAQGYYPIGQLPAGCTINWPAAPTITRTVDVADATQFQQEATPAGSRIRVTADISSPLSINASDIEVRLNPGVRVGRLRLGRSVKRVCIKGGTIGSIDFPEPVDFNDNNRVYPEWFVEDVLVDSVQLCNTDRSGMELRGRRMAVLRSRAEAQRYCIWCGTMSGLQNEDVIIAGNFFFSKGTTANEATVRLVGVQRSVTVDNVLINSNGPVVMPAGSNCKHAYRIHGNSGGNFAARNTLVNSGVMIGTMAGDAVDSMWFNDNTFYHVVSDLFNLNDAAISYAQVRGNVIHTNVWGCFYCRTPPANWDVAENLLDAYQLPPQDIVDYAETACGSLAIRGNKGMARRATGTKWSAGTGSNGQMVDLRGRVVRWATQASLTPGVYCISERLGRGPGITFAVAGGHRRSPE